MAGFKRRGNRSGASTEWRRRGRFWIHKITGEKMPVISGGGGSAAFDQDRFRFRKDDGDLTAATWAGALNANIGWAPGANIRLRLAIQETAGVRSTNWYFRLYYRINGGTWTYASTGSYYSSSWFVDEAADNVQRLGTGQTFTGGGGNENVQIGTGDWIDFNGSDEYELEFCFRVPTACVAGDTVDYQVWKSQSTTYTALNTYTRTPQITVGANVSNTIPAFLKGGGYPSDSLSAYMTGDYPRSHVHAFLEGWRDGYSAKKAWMRGKAPSVHAYTYGQGGVKVAVVPFNARTSAGTQDIVSSKLAGTSCKLAMLFGNGSTAYDTVTANSRIFFGATDGTTSWLRYGYHLDGANPGVNSQGGDSTTYCAGFVSATGGYATFDSWLTGSSPGVRINWGQGAPGAMKCCAILIGAASDEAFQCKVGNLSLPASADGDEREVIVDFKPQSILFHSGHGSYIQQGLGLAYWNEQGALQQFGMETDWDWTGYMDVSGGWFYGSGQTGDEVVFSHRTYGATGYARFRVIERLVNAFRIQHMAQSAADDAHYIAMRYAEDFSISYILPDYVSTTGNHSFATGNRPQAILEVISRGGIGYCDSLNCYNFNSFGYSAFDDTNQECCTINHGDSQTLWECKSTATQGATLAYDRTQTLTKKATRVSMDATGFTLNYSTAADLPFMIVFGGGFKAKSNQHAYMFAHWRRVNAFTRGQIHDKSAQHAFYWVVDAQDSIHAYTEGLQPIKSSVHAYMMGTGTAAVIMIPFTTASGATQDITSPELTGMTVKAVYCIIQDGTGEDDVFQDGWQTFGHGFTDGTHSWYETITSTQDANTPYSMAKRHGYDVGFICLTNSTGGIRLKGTFNSFITNGVRVNWTNQNAGLKGLMIFFAGSDVSALVSTYTLTGGGADTVVTAPGWTPDLILHATSKAPAAEYSNYADALNEYENTAIAISANNGERTSMVVSGGVRSGSSSASDCLAAHYMGMTFYLGPLSGDYNPPPVSEDRTYVIHTYDANGFTIRAGAEAITPPNPSAYLAVKFGNKLRVNLNVIPILRTQVSGKYKYVLPWSSRNIIPTFAWVMAGLGWLSPLYWTTVDGIPYKQTSQWTGPGSGNKNSGGMMDLNGPTWGFATPSQRWGFANMSGAHYWDCDFQQWSDRVAAHIRNVTWTLHGYYAHPTVMEWYEEVKAKIASLITNGVEIDWNYSIGGYPTINEWVWPVILIGVPEEKSSQHAYMKGQKVNWRGRTPRGAYLMGAVEGTAADSSTPAFLEGAGIPIKTSQAAYCKGQMDAVDSQECYARGSGEAASSTPAFTKAAIPASSSIPAYTRSGTEVKSSCHAYIWSDYSRSSTPAYLEGFAAGANVSSKPAFMVGGGTFPFTDDFTGSDGSMWNDMKWESSEQ